MSTRAGVRPGRLARGRTLGVACEESGREEELIAVESLRRALVLEIVAARERQRQEKRLEVEVEDR